MLPLVICLSLRTEPFFHPVDVNNKKWFCVRGPDGHDLPDLNNPLIIAKKDWFNIQTRLPYPGVLYDWREEDEWELEAYDIPSFELIQEDRQLLKDGDLFKWWVFKAINKGNFEIVLSRSTQKVIIAVIVQ